MSKTNVKSSLALPPGSLGWPVVGETIAFLTDGQFAEKREKKYGPVFKTNIFGRPTVFMLGPEANQFLFANENKYFAATWPKSTRILLGPASLSTQTGNFHQQRRKLMSQAFQPRALAGYLPAMERITASYLEKWQQMGTLTWYPELRNYTFDIASRLLVGSEGGSETKLVELFENWVAGLFTIALPLPGTKFKKALRYRQQLLAEMEKIILRRQKEDNPGEDALGILLQARDEDGNSLPLEELKDQILLLLFAGHETLTSAIASFCLLMAQHPDVTARAREEQQQFPTSEPLTMERLKQMTYLDAILKEVLRVTPPVGGGFREVIEDCEYGGYAIPKGWATQYNIGKTHQDENIYPHHEQFDPDRFIGEDAADKKQRFGYIPFGGGMRECLGKEFARLEMRVFAAMLLRGYRWELLPEQDLSLVAIPTPHPRDGLKVKFSS
jgi:cytochrome P450